jgi:hypothetical protein
MPRKPWKQYPGGTGLRNWLEYNFAERHEKSIQALVYVGAALLVIIVGLRGLGDISGISYIPKFLLNQDGKIDSSVVMIGLLVEFTMLCLLAAVSFFSPQNKEDGLQRSINYLASNIETLALGIQSEAGENLVNTARESTNAIKIFINKEIEVIESFKIQTEQQFLSLNDEVSKIKQELIKDVANSTSVIADFLHSERNSLSKYFSSVESLITANKESFQSIANNLAALAKNSATESKGIFEREKDIINNFYKINSGLISKSGEEFRETLLSFGNKVDNMVTDAKLAFHEVTNSLKEGVKNSTSTSNEVFDREKEMIEKFYNINSELITKSNEEFSNVLKNYNNIIGEESERLKLLSTKQLNPQENSQQIIKTNDKLIAHLENIDKTLKIMLQKNGAFEEASDKNHLFNNNARLGWKRFFNRTTS